MALTASQLLAHIRHRTGGPIGDEVGGGVSVINIAGRWLMSSRSWDSSRRVSVVLGLTAGQSYIDLPADFEELIQPLAGVGTLFGYQIVSLGELNGYRSSLAGYGGAAAISWRLSATTGLPIPVLEVWPTPSATVASALSLVYRAKWVDIDDGDDRVLIPGALEGLLIYSVRELAYAMEKGEDWGLALGAIQVGPIYLAAAAADSLTSRHMGMFIGGAAGDVLVGEDWALDRSTIVNPP